MSAFRDSLAPETRSAFAACASATGPSYAAGALAMHKTAAADGPMAVARKAWWPGHRLGSPEAIAARYAELYGGPREQAA